MSSRPDPTALEIDHAVRELTARYCDAVARFDLDQFAELWTDDADWVVPGVATTTGRDRIARLFGKLRGSYLLCTQEPMSGWVVPGAGPDEARARWQIRELQWKAEQPVNCVMGVYSDRLVRVDGAWRFATRQFDVFYRGPVDLSGTVHPVAPLPPLGA